nr:hypothetical protein [Sphingomonas liriopis]
MHHDVTHVGLRAQATAVGLIQLCIELRTANVLDDSALTRIKQVIGDELLLGPYRRHASRDDRDEVRARLDRLFAGEEKIGPVDELQFLTEGDT